jgi:hypothetical protein
MPRVFSRRGRGGFERITKRIGRVLSGAKCEALRFQIGVLDGKIENAPVELPIFGIPAREFAEQSLLLRKTQSLKEGPECVDVFLRASETRSRVTLTSATLRQAPIALRFRANAARKSRRRYSRPRCTAAEDSTRLMGYTFSSYGAHG